MSAIEVRDLVKRFGDKTVVDHVSMDVAEGEIVGFLGPNGSGKTTTIRIMCGLLTPDEGDGEVLGYDLLTEALKIKREVGYMTQKFSFYEDLTIAENLMFVARLYGLKPAQLYVDKTLANLGLTSRRDQLAGTLSGGWKQRLALAACIMHEPRHEHQVLSDRQILVKREFLGHVADLALYAEALGPQIVAQHAPFALVGREQAAHDADRRRLAGAVRTEETDDFAFGHVHRDMVDDGLVAEALDEVSDFDGGHGPVPF